MKCLFVDKEGEMHIPEPPPERKYMEKHPEYYHRFWEEHEDILCNVCALLHVPILNYLWINDESYSCCKNCWNKAKAFARCIWKEQRDWDIYEHVLDATTSLYYGDPIRHQRTQEILNSDEFRVYNECLSAIYLWNKPEIKL